MLSIVCHQCFIPHSQSHPSPFGFSLKKHFNDTYFDAKCLWIFVLGKLHVADYQLNVASRPVIIHEKLIEILFQWKNNQLMHHAFENLVQIEELVVLQRCTSLVNFDSEVLFAMLYQIVFHSVHELANVAHNFVWNLLSRFARARDKVVNVFGEY